MADILMVGSVAVGVLNAVLALALIGVYGAVYAKTKAPFTLALVVFGLAFLLHNGLVIYSYLSMMPLLPPEMNPYLLGIGALEAGGLGAVLWTATR
ncbi:MAG: hypothetical protein A3K65_07530 [Euryarchaeota archaeon RBG_16_68_12]|nr:MAG: hypothetical protein A3K65_07530 [Euryarchaeota archaeon RBG_16_68_12]